MVRIKNLMAIDIVGSGNLSLATLLEMDTRLAIVSYILI
jgi:hypothetical protein